MDNSRVLDTARVTELFGKIHQVARDKFGVTWKVTCPKCKKHALVVSEGLAEGHCFVCFWSVKHLGIKTVKYADQTSPTPAVTEVTDVSKEFNAFFYPLDDPISIPGRNFIVNERGVYNYDMYRLRYCPVGQFGGRVIIPIYQFDNLVGFQARTIFPDVTPKYLFSNGFKKSKYLYNFDLAKKFPVVFVVEGVIDAMKACPYTVSTFGAGISEYQMELLATYWKICVFIPDNDDAGRIGFMPAAKWVGKLIPTYTINIDGYHDFGEAPMSTVQNFIKVVYQEIRLQYTHILGA